MKGLWKISVLGVLPLLGLGLLWAAETPPPGQPAGFVVLDHVSDQTCLAVRVTVPEDQAISGLRWFNGGLTPRFDQVLVASGSGLFPPALTEAVSLADSVEGNEEAWSELAFSEPVGSTSGSLFLIMQYPALYSPEEGATPLAVGYLNAEGRGAYFVTDDGEAWVKVSSRCQLMMEPVFCLRDSTMLVKSNRPEDELPGALPKEFGVKSYPNPFNPVAKIELALPKAADCSLKIYDIRGRLVRDFNPGRLEAGYHTFAWEGRDDRGQSVSSGVYFAQVKADDKTLNRRLILIK